MSKSKFLRSLTVIPEHLYVERDADRQVAKILEEMGRPGYVLVARQMGKTNLLLHAKQFLKPESDVFLYIDVSNPIPDIREFFRNIIDVATEVFPQSAETLNDIAIGRHGNTRLAHREHESELRILLRSIPGRLIVCLDEIDAIAGSAYSDQVFTFIRSVYFGGRLNFPEFNRLTYLLSGVAEPADIIKNKDVSPFNIGEKIYLNDFSLAEVSYLVQRASIPMTEEIISRVYYWTSGHPRMTWDVCSELEDRDQTLTIDDVDSAVKKLYFGEVDVPPIDHIKKLVLESREIRDSLIAIHYKKSITIPQSTRTKLYLAGITSYDIKEKTISFKNQILETALSESYLLKSVTEQTDPLTSWVERAESKNYAAALPGLLVFVTSAEDAVGRSLASYYAGYCYFWMGNYEEALNYLKEDSGELRSDLALMRVFYTGVASWQLFRYQSAVVFFEYIANLSGNEIDMPWLRVEARAYLASCLTQDKTPQTERVKNICLEIANSVENISGEPITLERSELKGFAAVILAQAYKLEGNVAAAAQVLELEIELQEERLKADLSIRLLQYIVVGANGNALDRAHALAMSANINSSGAQRPHEDLSLDQFLVLITKLIEADRHEDALRVAEHVFKVAPKGEVLNEAITSICSLGLKLPRRRQIAAKLFGLGLEAGDDSLPVDQKRELLGLVLFIGGEESLIKYSDRYIQTFESASLQELGLADFRPLYLIIAESKNRLSDQILEKAYRAINMTVAQGGG
ncbi:AAA-like domain-containing protein [Acidovorax sp. 1608163]|uniref:AAA-like domain-containing protein n=1 Tax=Acidovorax sp. 1608163 TaxID=2478662 RepID=UPI0013CED6A2|nr:AAA-like domain-containing protein [Acidovorax sp. 1608163]